MKSSIVAGLALLLLASCAKHARTVLSSADTEGMVQTPYGLVPASRVHAVDNHTVAKMVDGRLSLVDMNTGRTVGDLGVPTAADRAARDPYAFARTLRGEVTVPTVTTFGTNPTFGTTGASGRDEGSYYTSASLSGIQSLSTNWLVPNFPLDTVNPVTIFYWNALDGGALQPVLQYDQGYGNAYTLANWYFTEGQYFHGTFIPVTPGTSLQGVITFVSNPNDTTWNYKESFTGYPAGDVNITRTTEATDPALCLEAYTQNLAQWPNQPFMQFTSIDVTMRSGPAPDSLHWTPGGGSVPVTPSLLNSVVVNSSATNGEVDMYFGDGTGITPDSSFHIVSGVNGTSVLDITAGGTSPGTKVELWSPNSPVSSNQVWRAVALPGGYYEFQAGNDTAMALTDSAGGTGNGTQIVIEPYTGSTAQKWKVTPVGGGYNTLSPASAPSSNLDVYAHDTGNGTKIEIWSANGGTNQQFRFVLE
ncbi:RICIN domain-containing protein [Dinghuibacter silviterrae]|uniref:Ricin-type beta-trefoil lectin protein n=1 Tax=Dinghuibacter silviterrae TaxID=1539049 RepID=A0A4R8DF48_9BACT|nr:RICIN domain-containing protein [Dinghuibacter silviterrae]TDW95864.1 ricin-type beta-trefoil lectin protein [Dinghuibacter silviterrae]